MKIYVKSAEKQHQNDGCVATIGFFDGVHLGHRFLLDCVKQEARRRGVDAVAVTFPDSPSRVLHPERDIKLLTMPEEKIRLLHDAGIDRVAMLPFTSDVAALSAEDFMTDVLKGQLGVDVLVMGYDHRFGHGGGTNFRHYADAGSRHGIEVLQAKLFTFGDDAANGAVSSSAIRDALLTGDLTSANRGLGYLYGIEGVVVGGYHVGTQLGYPTANIGVDSQKLIPANGVYAVRVRVGESTEALGMLNIGCRPTLGNDRKVSIEVNIFDFHEDIYSQKIAISFVQYVRKEQRFDSTDELTRQLKHDEQVCRRILTGC